MLTPVPSFKISKSERMRADIYIPTRLSEKDLVSNSMLPVPPGIDDYCTFLGISN